MRLGLAVGGQRDGQIAMAVPPLYGNAVVGCKVRQIHLAALGHDKLLAAGADCDARAARNGLSIGLVQHYQRVARASHREFHEHAATRIRQRHFLDTLDFNIERQFAGFDGDLVFLVRQQVGHQRQAAAVSRGGDLVAAVYRHVFEVTHLDHGKAALANVAGGKRQAL